MTRLTRITLASLLLALGGCSVYRDIDQGEYRYAVADGLTAVGTIGWSEAFPSRGDDARIRECLMRVPASEMRTCQ